MDKPIQIAVGIALTGKSPFLEDNSSIWAVYVLTESGRIHVWKQFDTDEGKWEELTGPWVLPLG